MRRTSTATGRLSWLYGQVRRATGQAQRDRVVAELSSVSRALDDVAASLSVHADLLRELHSTSGRLAFESRRAEARLHWLGRYASAASRDFEASSAPVDPLDWELSVRSQNGEDGILLAIIAAVGAVDRTSVELGSGSVRECSTAHLLLDRGWRGALLEGDSALAAEGEAFVRQELGVDREGVVVQHAWVTADNVSALVAQAAGEKPIDVLAIDLDGNDYWIWRALDGSLSPRVVVIEYNASFGPDRSATVPYDEQFVWPAKLSAPNWSLAELVYHGASLAALEGLATEKGYRLIGCDSFGVNAFFVRADLAGRVRTRSAAEAWRPSAYRSEYADAEQMAALEAQPVVGV